MKAQCNRCGAQTGYEELAPLLSREGFHALVLDGRGFGRSRDQRFDDYHAQMDLIDTLVPQDVEAAYQFLVSRPGVDPLRVAVVAASCGTWQAIPLAADHSEIRTLVFLSGSFLGLEAIERAYQAIADRPILAIYSEEDRYGTPESMQAAFSRSRHKATQLKAYKGDLHGAFLFGLDRGLEGRIVERLEAHLAPRR